MISLFLLLFLFHLSNRADEQHVAVSVGMMLSASQPRRNSGTRGRNGANDFTEADEPRQSCSLTRALCASAWNTVVYIHASNMHKDRGLLQTGSFSFSTFLRTKALFSAFLFQPWKLLMSCLSFSLSHAASLAYGCPMTSPISCFPATSFFSEVTPVFLPSTVHALLLSISSFPSVDTMPGAPTTRTQRVPWAD